MIFTRYLWKLLAQSPLSWPKIIIHGNLCIILYIFMVGVRILVSGHICSETTPGCGSLCISLFINETIMYAYSIFLCKWSPCHMFCTIPIIRWCYNALENVFNIHKRSWDQAGADILTLIPAWICSYIYYKVSREIVSIPTRQQWSRWNLGIDN